MVLQPGRPQLESSPP